MIRHGRGRRLSWRQEASRHGKREDMGDGKKGREGRKLAVVEFGINTGCRHEFPRVLSAAWCYMYRLPSTFRNHAPSTEIRRAALAGFPSARGTNRDGGMLTESDSDLNIPGGAMGWQISKINRNL